MLKSIKKIYHLLKGDYLGIKKQIDCNTQWYGSMYGGFYVYPDILSGASIVYSFGIGEDVTFDRDIVNRHGCIVYGFDPTPKSINWISRQDLPSQFTFCSYGIDINTGNKDFYLPKKKEHVSGSVVQNNNINANARISVKMKSFKDIVSEFNHSKIDIVKMDIEGSEYEILPYLLTSDIEIGQILIEFHHRMLKHGKALTINAIKQLNDSGYEVFAVSESLEEISFIKKQSILAN
jgi:FkbM family methyltransferase